MSAAGRGTDRVADDFYETPSWCVDRLFESVTLPGGRWIEPCAGRGAIIRAVARHRADVEWTACELRDEHRPALKALRRQGVRATMTGDFLEVGMIPGAVAHADVAQVVITNPPYRLAFEVLDVARACAPLAYVALLLRLNFLASQSRCQFLREHPPDVYVLPNRPSFREVVKIRPDGKRRKTTTDATEYAWMIWHPSSKAGIYAPMQRGTVEVLGMTPVSERRPGSRRSGFAN